MAKFPIEVTVDPRGAVIGTQRVRRELDLLDRGAQRLRAALFSAFAVFASGAAIIGGIKVLADFEEGMAQVRAVTNATTREFELLREESKRLGITTRFSATDAASAMLFLARAGFEANEVLATVGDTLLLAQAGALDLGSAADIASNVLKGFRLSVLDLAEVVDVLALAANSSNTDVRQLGDALKFVGPIAAGLGISLQSTTAAIGVLSDAGLQATLAGTGLRRVLSELETPSEKSANLILDLGLSLEEVRPSAVGLVEALKKLEAAGVDTGAALEVFGDRGGPAFEVLSKSIPDIERQTEALERAGGTAERIARINDDNLKGSFLAVRSAIEGFTIAVGDAGATSNLRAALGGLASGVRSLASNLESAVPAIEAVGFAIGVLLVAKIVSAVATLATLSAALNAVPWIFIASLIAYLTYTLIQFATDTGEAAAGVGLLNRQFENTSEILGRIAKQDLTIVNARDVGDQELLISGLTTKIKELQSVAIAFGDETPVSPRTLQRFAPDIELDPTVELTNSGLVPGAEVERVLGEQIRVLEGQVAAARERLAVERGDVAATEAAKRALEGYFEALDRQKQLAGATKEDQALLNAEFDILDLAAQGGTDSLGAFTDAVLAAQNAVRDTQAAAAAAGIRDFISDLKDQNETLAVESAAIQESALARQQAVAVLSAERIAREGNTNLTVEEIEEIRQLVAQQYELSKAIQAVEDSRRSGTAKAQTRGAAVQALLGDLEKEAELLRGTAEEQRIAAGLAQAEQQFRRALNDQTVELTETERQLLSVKLADNIATAERGRVLAQAIGPVEQLAERQRILADEIERTGDPTGRLAAGLRDAKIAALELETDGLSGLERGLLKYQKQALDVASTLESALVSAFRGVEDAFVDFVRTGEVDFGKLVDSIIADLARLLAQQAIASLIGGPVGGLASSFFGRAGGGSAASGQPYVVGEKGPELFVPATSGMVVPTDTTAALMTPQAPSVPTVQVSPPQVNVQIVNVRDRSEIPDGIESPEGTRAVMNVLSKNRNTVRELSA